RMCHMRASRGSHRVLRCIAVLTLILGVVGAAGSAFAGSGDCAMRATGEMQGGSHCQWMMPAACCDQPSSVSGATPVVPKPSITIALVAPPPPAGIAAWLPAHASEAPQVVFPASVVLRL